MKKITQTLLAVAAIAMIIASCGSKSGSDPKSVLTEFFKRMSEKDIDGATKLATKDRKATMDMMKKGLDMAKKAGTDTANSDDPTEEFKQLEIGDAKITGETALVPVTNKKENNKTMEFPLKKEDGEWKVDFSMATLMKMGKDAAGQGVDAMDETGKEVTEEEIQKSMEAADTILKKMDPKKMEELKKEIEKAKEQ